MYLYGLKKYIWALKLWLECKSARTLPLKFKFYIWQLLKNEKLVKLDSKYIIFSQFPPYPSKAFDRYLEGLSKIAHGMPVPLSLEVGATSKCKYNCWHCSNTYRSGKEISKARIIQALTKFQSLGTAWICFTGGEPLLREDIFEIISAIDKDKSSVALFTTGQDLTERVAEKLKVLGVFCLLISLDSDDKDRHDTLRGYSGAYENALNAVKISKAQGFYTVISAVATKDNIISGELLRVLKFAKELGVHECRILEIAPAGKLIYDTSTALDTEARKKIISMHIRANRSFEYPRVLAFPYFESPAVMGCAGGYQHLVIDSRGNVCPCPFLPLSMGNINEEDVFGWNDNSLISGMRQKTLFGIEEEKPDKKVVKKGAQLEDFY